MKFGIFYEHQLPRPWTEGAEQKLFNDALEQVEVADRLGIDYAWEVEHHFLEEYSHSSAPEVFLAACAARTKNIRLGPGHPAGDTAVQPPGENGRGDRDARSRFERSRRFRHRRILCRARTRRLRHHGRREAQDLPRIDRADLQHPRDGSVPGLRRQVLQHAVPQPGAEAGAASASAGVGRVFAARNDPDGGATRHRCADVRIRRSARSAVVGRGVLQHHQERRVRADRPHRQRQHLHGVELLVSPGPRDGDQARPQRLRVLRLRARQPLWLRRAQAGSHQSVAGVRERVRAAHARSAAGDSVRPCRAAPAASARRTICVRTCASSKPPASTR